MRAYHCTVDLWSVQAWKYFMFIQPHFCLDVSRVSVHIFTCRCVFVIFLPLHLFLTGKPQADWIGYTPLFPLDHPTPALFLSLPLVPLCNGTKALLWNGLTSPCSLCVLFLLCWIFWKEVFAFDFYLFNNFYNFLGYPKEYWFDITPNSCLLLSLFFCWVPAQPQATSAQQAEQHIQTARNSSFNCLHHKITGDRKDKFLVDNGRYLPTTEIWYYCPGNECQFMFGAVINFVNVVSYT